MNNKITRQNDTTTRRSTTVRDNPPIIITDTTLRSRSTLDKIRNNSNKDKNK